MSASGVRIFQPHLATGYEFINAVDGNDYEEFLRLDGKPRGEGWRPIAVRRICVEEGREYKASDFPWLGSSLIMRRSAVDALRDMIDRSGELLPLRTDDSTELFVLNTQSIDALDEDNSSLMRANGTNRIMRVIKPVFIPSAVRDLDIFRLPYRASAIFLSQRFVERVQAAGLKGLKFTEVWHMELH